MVGLFVLSCAIPMSLPPPKSPKNKQVKIYRNIWGEWRVKPPTLVFEEPRRGESASVEWHFSGAKKGTHCAAIQAKPAQPDIFERDEREFVSPPGDSTAISSPLKTEDFDYPAYWAYEVLIIETAASGTQPCGLKDGKKVTGKQVASIDPAVCVKGGGGGCPLVKDY